MPIVLSCTMLCASTRFYYGTITINTRTPICSSNCLPSCPFFVVRCLRRYQAHVQAVALWATFRYANKSAILLNFRHGHLLSVILSMAMCNSLWRHVPGALLSCLIQTTVIFNKTPIGNVQPNFLLPQSYETPTLCPSFCSSYCSHSWLQYCCMGRQKSLYLFKTPEQT